MKKLDKYTIKPSQKQTKKYDVYINDKYLLSFGDRRYQQYYDKFGYYSHLNHNDVKRRKQYRSRHRNDYIDNPNYAGYWSWHYLW